MRKLITLGTLCLSSLSPLIVCAEGSFVVENQAYSQAFVQTHKSDAGTKIDLSQALSVLSQAKSRASSSASRLSQLRTDISSLDRLLSELADRGFQIDRTIRDLDSRLRDYQSEAMRNLGLRIDRRTDVDRYIFSKRGEYQRLDDRKDQLERRAKDLLRSAPYSTWDQELGGLKQGQKLASQKLENARNTLKQQQGQVQNLDAQIVKQQKSVAGLEQEIVKLQNDSIPSGQAKVQKAQSAVDAYNGQSCSRPCVFAKANLKNEVKQLQKLEGSLAKYQAQLAAIPAQIASLEKNRDSVQSEIQSLKSKIPSFEQDVARIQPQMNALETKMEAFRREKIRPLVSDRERVESDMREVSRIISYADTLGNRLEDTHESILAKIRERDNLPYERDRAEEDRRDLNARLPKLESELRADKVEVDHAQASVNEVQARRSTIWAVLDQAQIKNDQALGTSVVGSVLSALSMTTFASPVITGDWSYVGLTNDLVTGEEICLAETVTQAGERLQVLRIRDQISKELSLPLVRVVLSEGSEVSVLNGTLEASGLSSTLRRFELNSDQTLLNNMVAGHRDVEKIIPAIKKLNTMTVKAKAGSLNISQTVFSLKGSSKTMDTFYSSCR